MRRARRMLVGWFSIIALAAGLSQFVWAGDVTPQASEITRKVERGFTDASVKLTLADVEAYFELRNIDNMGMIPGMPGSTVCSFMFVKLGEFQQTVLLASTDSSGRHFCNGVVVVGKAGGRIWQSGAFGWQIDDVTRLIIRPDGAARSYLAVASAFSDYGGWKCTAVVPRIYDLARERLVEVSSQFPLFYEKKAKSWPYESGAPDAAVCKTMEVDKLKRLSGREPRAGFDTAAKWMTNADADTRLKAVQVFGDIWDQASQRKLRAMANDPDAIVVQSVQALLKNGNKNLP